MTANGYNENEYIHSRLTWDHLTEMIEYWQENHGLTSDGMAGPKTRDSLFKIPDDLEPIFVNPHGFLVGPGVKIMQADNSWSYSKMGTAHGEPEAIVAHYTATSWGTAINMANRRMVKRKSNDRDASWHISIEGDGEIVQMISTLRGAWHAGGGFKILGMSPNRISVGIELVGHGSKFPAPQVHSAARVWRALVESHPIVRADAMHQHSVISPSRRSDPGSLWMGRYAKKVLEYAYT